MQHKSAKFLSPHSFLVYGSLSRFHFKLFPIYSWKDGIEFENITYEKPNLKQTLRLEIMVPIHKFYLIPVRL